MAVLKPFPETRSKAARVRTLAQLAALIAAVAAGAAVVTNFIGPADGPAAAAVTVRPLDTKKWVQPPDANQGKADLDGIGSRMMLVSNSPKIAEIPKVDTAAPPVIPPSSVKDHVKFLGVVADGARFFALIAVDGKQRIVGIGDVIKFGEQSATVTAITADSISLDDGKKTEVIELAHHSGSVVSRSAAQPMNAVGVGATTVAGAGKGGPDRHAGNRGKPIKDPLAGLDPKARAMAEEANARAGIDAREMRRKVARIQLEKETGRSGEEIEKILDAQEQAGKLDFIVKEAESKGKGGK